jgi:hypothetical protein
MAIKRIPIGINWQNIDPVEHHDGVAAGHKNCYMVPVGDYEHFIGFDGLESFINGLAGTPQGGFDSTATGKKLIVAGGVVQEIDNGYVVATYTGGTLNSSNPAIFTETENFIYLATGDNVTQIDTSTQTITNITAAGSPQTGVTHVAFIDGYILANGLSAAGIPGDVYYSLDDGVTWGFFNNEKLPDGTTAVITGWEEIYGFGPRSVEVSYNDGVTPFGVLDGAFMQYGLLAAYSAIVADNTLYWLGEADGARRIFKMVGRTPSIISTPYDKVLQGLGTVSDARAWTQQQDGYTFYVITFPTEDLTLFYNIQLDKWSERTFWDTATASNKRYKGGFAFYVRDWNKTVVGDYGTSKLYVSTGGTDDGEEIRVELTSGRIAHGYSNRKKRKRLVFEIKRGDISDFNEAVFEYRIKTDNKGWSNWKQKSLGKVGESNPYIKDYRSGVYRSAQYQVVYTGSTSEFIFMGLQEDFDVLRD